MTQRRAWALFAMWLAACGSSSSTTSSSSSSSSGGNGDTCTPAGGTCQCGCNPGAMQDTSKACPQGPPGSGICGAICCVSGVDGGGDAAADGSNGGCDPGTCRLSDSGPCEKPTGQLGNGCCKCGDDGKCAALCQWAAPRTPIATAEGTR